MQQNIITVIQQKEFREDMDLNALVVFELLYLCACNCARC